MTSVYVSALLRQPGADAVLAVLRGLLRARLAGEILRGVLVQDVRHGGQAVLHCRGALDQLAELVRVGFAYRYHLAVVVYALIHNGLQQPFKPLSAGREGRTRALRSRAARLGAEALPHEPPGPVLIFALGGNGEAQIDAEHAAVRLVVRHAGEGVFPAVALAYDAEAHEVLQRLELQQADIVLAYISGQLRARLAALAQEAEIRLAVEGAGPGFEVGELHGGEVAHPAPEDILRHPGRENGQVRRFRRGLGLVEADARLRKDVRGRGEGDHAEGVGQRGQLAQRAHGGEQAGDDRLARIFRVGVEVGQEVLRRRRAEAGQIVIVAEGEDIRPLARDELGVQQLHAHTLVIQALDAELVVRVLLVEGVHEVVEHRPRVVRQYAQLRLGLCELQREPLQLRRAGTEEDIAAVRLLPEAEVGHDGDAGLRPVEELRWPALARLGHDIAALQLAAQEQPALGREAQDRDAQLACIRGHEGHVLRVQLAEGSAAVHAVAHRHVDAPVRLLHGGEIAPLLLAHAAAGRLAVRAELNNAHVVHDVVIPVPHSEAQVAVKVVGGLGGQLHARGLTAAVAEDARARLREGQGGRALARPADGVHAQYVLRQRQGLKRALRVQDAQHRLPRVILPSEDELAVPAAHGVQRGQAAGQRLLREGQLLHQLLLQLLPIGLRGRARLRLRQVLLRRLSAGGEAQAEAQGQDNRCHAPEVAHKITPKYDVIVVFIHILQEMCIGVASNSGVNVNKL